MTTLIARPAALALLLCGMAAPLDAQEPAWETVRIDLDVRLLPDADRLDGDAILRLRPVRTPASELALQVGEAIAIRAVTPVAGPPFAVSIDSAGSGATLRFERAIPVGAEVEVEVAFASVGRGFQMVVDPAAAFASWARTWYPIAEAYAAPGATRIAMPAAWRAVASGGLVDRTEAGGRAVETWATDRPLARSFAAGPYAMATREIGGRAIGTYLLTRPERADEFAAALADIMGALEARFGPYPYAGYALAEVPEGLAGWTGSSEQGFFLARSDALEGPVNLPLLAHELAHGWWGNWVRAVGPGSLLTGEALAQYAAVLAIEALEGEDAAIEFLRFSRAGYSRIQSAKGFWTLKLAGHDRPLAELTGEGQDHNLADAKGHWVWSMLRQRLGDERFFGTLRGVLAERGGGTLSLPELRAAFLEAAPEDEGLEGFLAQWLDRPGAPLLSTSWEDASAGGLHAARVTIRQRTPEPYRITVAFGVESAAGLRVHEVELTEARTVVELEADGPPTGIVENVGHEVLLWEAAYCPE